MQAIVRLVDKPPNGYNSSGGTYGAGNSLRENGEVQFNFKEVDEENFDSLSHFYRIRINKVRLT